MNGKRALSRITLDIDVIHDGEARFLGAHVAVEIDALLERWGAHCESVAVTTVHIVHRGDQLSRDLPAIGCEHAGGGRRAPSPPA